MGGGGRILQAGGMCFQQASGNDFSDTWKARWPGQPFRTKLQQSRLIKLQITLIIVISSIFPKVTGYYGEGQQKSSEILRFKKLGLMASNLLQIISWKLNA